MVIIHSVHHLYSFHLILLIIVCPQIPPQLTAELFLVTIFHPTPPPPPLPLQSSCFFCPDPILLGCFHDRMMISHEVIHPLSSFALPCSPLPLFPSSLFSSPHSIVPTLCSPLRCSCLLMIDLIIIDTSNPVNNIFKVILSLGLLHRSLSLSASYTWYSPQGR